MAMSNLLNKQRYFLLFIFILAFSLRIGYAFLEKISPNIIDAGYNEIGKNMAQGKGYRIADGPIENDEAIGCSPGYPFFLGLIYIIFGYNYRIVWIIQSIIGAFICILIFFIAERLFDQRVARISAVISAICFNLVIYPAILYSETLFLLLILLCFVYIYKADKLVQNSKYLIAGFFGALGVLTRPIILASLLFFELVSFKKRIKSIALFFFPVILLILLWVCRNYYIYKQLIPICAGIGEVIWDGHHSLANGEYVLPQEVPENLPLQEYIKIDNLGYRRALKFILEHPIKSLLLELKKISLFFSIVRTDAWWSHIKGIDRIFSFILSLLFNLLIFGFGIMGIIFSYTKANKYISWIRRFMCIYILSLLPFVIVSRYRQPIYPFLIIFAGYSLSLLPKIRLAFISKDKQITHLFYLSVFLFSLIILNSLYDLFTYKDLALRIHILKTGIPNPW